MGCFNVYMNTRIEYWGRCFTMVGICVTSSQTGASRRSASASARPGITQSISRYRAPLTTQN